MKIFRFRLQGQLLLPILFVVVFCIAALQGASYWKSSEVLEQEIVRSIDRDRDSAVRFVDEWFENKIAAIELWRKDDRFLRVLLEVEGTRSAADQFALEAKKSSSDIKNIALVNSDGLVVASSTNRDKVTNVSNRAYFKESMQGKTHISRPLISKNTGHPLLMISTPVKNAAGRVQGVLMLVTEFEGMYNKVFAPIKIADSGFAFATDSAGMVIAHPDAERVMRENVAETDYGKAMLANRDGLYKYYDTLKNQDIALSYGTSKSGWHVAIVAPLGELLAPLKTARNMAAIGTLATILITGLVILLTVRSFTKALKIVVDNANLIAGGAVDIVVPDSLANKQDELGELGRAFRIMAANLKTKIEEITEQSAIAQAKAVEAMEATSRAEEAQKRAECAQKEGILHAARSLEQIVVQVASASEELNSQIQESRKGTDVQRARVTETATAMEQMSATVLEVAGNAANAAENADNVRSQAESGQDLVNRVTDSIGLLNEEAGHLQDEMKGLDNQVQGIGQIMTVITDIADQTNLLALNAAIEAARAGDAGRGFAVVADEVRKLAEKTMEATREVGDSIAAIQDRTGKSLQSMQQTSLMVADSTDLTHQARESLTTILNDVGQTAEQVRAIATAAEEQSATTEQISRSTDEINTIASETADAMEQSSIAIGELAKLCDELRCLIEEMKQEGDSGQ